MKITKRLAVLLALIMTLSMAGCSITINAGGDTSSTSDTADSTASAAETTDDETEDAAEQEAESVEPEEPEETEEPEEPEEQADAVDTSSSDAEEIEMSDSLYDYTFTLDGVVYQLPFAYTEMTDNGWSISSTGINGDTSISANSYQYLYMSKDGSRVCVYVINLSGNAKSLKDCKIGGIEVDAYDLMDVDLFSIAQGITLASTEDDITSAFGAATSSNTYDDYVSSKYEEGSYCYTQFYTYTEEKTKYNSISIKNYVSDESDVTETSEEVPDYLSSYVAPTELGSDVTSCVFELEGKLYQLPCPLSEFLDDGWTIKSKSGSVGSGNTDSVTLTKGSSNDSLYVYIANYASYQTIPENCAVYEISIYDDDNYDITLPGDLSFASDRDAVEAAVGNTFSYNSYTSYDCYSYYNYDNDNDIYIRIDIDNDTDMVEEFCVECKNWVY